MSAGFPSPEVARLASRKNFGRLERTYLPRKEVDVQEKHSGLFIAASLAAIACLATGGILWWVFVDRVLPLVPPARRRRQRCPVRRPALP
ncbi:hypothetical protein ACWDG1_45880 [Streptomyces sp. NPDC001177]